MFRRLIERIVFTTIPLRQAPIRNCAAQKHDTSASTNPLQSETQSTTDAYLHHYTPEECTQILKLLNSMKLQEMESYDISKGRATKLIAWKNRNGPLRTVQDILLVDGFGLKFADKFLQSLLHKSNDDLETNKPKRARFASYITPTIDVEQRESVRSCVAVRIGVSSVTWARLELPDKELISPCLLTHWHHHDISVKKLHLNELVQRCLYVDHLIPNADCYIFENPQMAQVNTNSGSAEQQNINIQKAQTTAIITFALTKRGIDENAIKDIPSKSLKRTHVFYMRRFLTARLFNHLVGTERVSSEDFVLSLMRTHYNINDKLDYILEGEANEFNVETNSELRANVEFPTDLRQMFAHAERYHREFLGQALLLNLAFVRLIILQDPKSIAIVTRQSNKDKLVE